jgi:hypothetical protein
MGSRGLVQKTCWRRSQEMIAIETCDLNKSTGGSACASTRALDTVIVLTALATETTCTWATGEGAYCP